MDIIKKYIEQALDGEISAEQCYLSIIESITIPSGRLENAEVGDYLRCRRVYTQSKRYTVGNLYRIINERQKKFPYKGSEICVRGDNGTMYWIDREGITYTYFALLKVKK